MCRAWTTEIRAWSTRTRARTSNSIEGSMNAEMYRELKQTSRICMYVLQFPRQVSRLMVCCSCSRNGQWCANGMSSDEWISKRVVDFFCINCKLVHVPSMSSIIIQKICSVQSPVLDEYGYTRIKLYCTVITVQNVIIIKCLLTYFAYQKHEYTRTRIITKL